jgi:hypothetical protein
MNNLNKKIIIQIVVIIMAFAGSGLVLYNGMFKKNSSVPLASMSGITQTGISSGATAEKILPYGEALDFKGVLNKQGLSYGALAYPVLDEKQDIGVKQQDMIKIAPQMANP